MLSLNFHGHTVSIRCSPRCAADVEALLGGIRRSKTPGNQPITVEDADDGGFVIGAFGQSSHCDTGSFLQTLMDHVIRGFVTDMSPALALHAGILVKDGRAVLVAGPTAAGKSSLVAWFVDNGFKYLSDEIAILDGNGELTGLRRGIVLKPGATEQILAMEMFRGATHVRAGQDTILLPPKAAMAKDRAYPCSMIVFPEFVADADLRLEPVSPARSALKLMACNLNARNIADGGVAAIGAFSRQAPAVSIRYSEFGQLSGTLDTLARFVLDTGSGSSRLLRAFSAPVVAPAPVQPKSFAIPAATPPHQRKSFTIGMATYDDYDGAYFSLQALRLYHGEALDDTELIVIDNHPDGPCGEALKILEKSISDYRYVPMKDRTGTAVRDVLFEEAMGDFVLCLDSHVFLAPGALSRLRRYVADHPQTSDLLQGPLLHDDMATLVGSHMDPKWRSGFFGAWGVDDRAKDLEAEPFEIPMQGLGLFACRRAAWPGFNSRFRGFGGEEGYIHEKFRRAGGRVLCLPFLRWVHRFGRPMGVPYRLIWEDRIRNYAFGFREVGLPTDEMEKHFAELLGEDNATRIFGLIDIEMRRLQAAE